MSELSKRILFSIITAPLFLAVLWVGGWYFIVMIVLLGLLIQYEMLAMFKAAGYPANGITAYLIGLIVMLCMYLPHSVLLGFLIFLYLIASETISTNTNHLNRLMVTLLCGIYAPLALLSLLLLRDLGNSDIGFALTLTLILIIWGNDSTAYFGGRKFGKHKLAPAISPGKTREGFYFGFLGGFLGLVIAYLIIPEYPFSIVYGIPMVIIAGFFGPVGDLAASKIKRSTGVKDSATILPGHGGFFDRFDALLLASPAVYIYVFLLLTIISF